MAETESHQPKSRSRVLPAVIGGSIAGLILLAGVGAGGLALGYHLGFKDGTSEARGNSDAHWPGPNGRPDRGDRHSPVGEWRGDLKGGKIDAVQLTLSADGKASGNDGCNGGGALWKMSGSKIYFDIFVSTKMACEGVDTYLYDTQVAELSKDGSTLKLFGEKSKALGELHRAAGNGGIVPPMGVPDPRPSTGPTPPRDYSELQKQRLKDGFKFREYENHMRERLQDREGN